jgi:hypothetical protein
MRPAVRHQQRLDLSGTYVKLVKLFTSNSVLSGDSGFPEPL